VNSSREEATSRPPQLPTRLRPSAVASKCTRYSTGTQHFSDFRFQTSDWIFRFGAPVNEANQLAV
jgi:hypothetical protein